MVDETTQPGRTLTTSTGAPERALPALALAWSRDEPERAGEVLILPSDRPGSVWTFGRDNPTDPRSRSLGLARQRPGATERRGPLACPRISRVQLHLSAGPTGTLVVENVGRCPLVHRGREVKSAELLPGDLVELRNEMLFLCARRPATLAMPADGHAVRLHPFGAPDGFGLIGEGPAMWDLRFAIAALAPLAVHVLLLGASGSGKELVARAIHAESQRRDRPFVARNAATIPEGVADAELFGHAKSFPNPGTPERPGLVGEASGGTLFLDELAELPPQVQAHLLRVLDGGEYHRLGESRARTADLRFIGATNRSPEALKHDVLARFTGRVSVPPLGVRREDIPLLITHLLRRQAASDPKLVARFFSTADASAVPRITPDLVAALVQHEYRTHVRELDALLLRAALESRGKYLERTEGVDRLLGEGVAAPPPSSRPAPSSGAPQEPKEAFSPEEERQLVLFRKHGFQPSEAARDPEYNVNRQTADLHLRKLLCRALAMGSWDVAAASAILAGEDAAQRDALRRRLITFLFNLRRRLEEEGSEALGRALAAEWRASAPLALRLLAAIEAGRVKGERP